MQTSFALINVLMNNISEIDILTANSEAIKAFEGKNMPVPIKKNYFSFSAEENKVTYFVDESGKRNEKNDIIIRMNCFTPLTLSPTSTHIIAEILLSVITVGIEGITGFTVGSTDYDSYVDAYKIECKIYYSATELIE